MAYDPRYVLGCFDTVSSSAKLDILRSLLEALILADIRYLQETPRTPYLYDAQLRYQEEELGQDEWRDIPEVLSHGGGDCEDLASYRVAELRYRMGEVSAQPYITSTIVEHPVHGTYTLYHIQVQRADGSIEDPSKLLGMP